VAAAAVPRCVDLGDRVGTGPLTAAGARAEWLRRVTSLGFLQVPAPWAPAPAPSERMRTRPDGLAWIDQDAATLLVGAMGHLRAFPSDLLGTLSRVAAGAPVGLKGLIEGATRDGADPAQARALTDWLLAARVLEP
jgi:hypothetical protein